MRPRAASMGSPGRNPRRARSEGVRAAANVGISAGERKSPVPSGAAGPTVGRACLSGRHQTHGGVGVDRVVVCDRQARGRDQRRQPDDALDEHGTVADGPGVAFVVDHLGRGARTHERVEARDGSARDRDEHERKQRSLHDRPAAVYPAREHGHLDAWIDENDTEHE